MSRHELEHSTQSQFRKFHPVRESLATLLLFFISTLGTAAHATTYSAFADFRNVQGYNGWRYLDTRGTDMFWDATLPGWRCFNYIEFSCFIRQEDVEPGADRDIIRRWVAPTTGTAHIIG